MRQFTSIFICFVCTGCKLDGKIVFDVTEIIGCDITTDLYLILIILQKFGHMTDECHTSFIFFPSESPIELFLHVNIDASVSIFQCNFHDMHFLQSMTTDLLVILLKCRKTKKIRFLIIPILMEPQFSCSISSVLIWRLFFPSQQQRQKMFIHQRRIQTFELFTNIQSWQCW